MHGYFIHLIYIYKFVYIAHMASLLSHRFNTIK